LDDDSASAIDGARHLAYRWKQSANLLLLQLLVVIQLSIRNKIALILIHLAIFILLFKGRQRQAHTPPRGIFQKLTSMVI